IEGLWGDLNTLEELPSYEPRIFNPHKQGDAKGPALDEFEQNALTRLLRASTAEEAFRKAGVPMKPYTFGDGTPMYLSRIMPGKKEYQYVQAVLYNPGCLINCHGPNVLYNHQMRQSLPGGKWDPVKAGDLAGVVAIRLRMEHTNHAIHNN